MGMFDTVKVPCPKCGELEEAQSKGGECNLDVFTLAEAPPAVLSDVNRHAPFKCQKCGAVFNVQLFTTARSRLIG